MLVVFYVLPLIEYLFLAVCLTWYMENFSFFYRRLSTIEVKRLLIETPQRRELSGGMPNACSPRVQFDKLGI